MAKSRDSEEDSQNVITLQCQAGRDVSPKGYRK